MSPEQIQSPRLIDWRTDIYSFGCVLYEMLAGRPPFGKETDSDFTIKQAHVQKTPDPLRRWNPGVPFECEWIVLRALSKDRDRRFSSAREMAEALQGVIRSSAPSTAPAGAEVRSEKRDARAQIAPDHSSRRPPARSSPAPIEQQKPSGEIGASQSQMPREDVPSLRQLLWPDLADQASARRAIRQAAISCILVGVLALAVVPGRFRSGPLGALLIAGFLLIAVSVGVWRRWKFAIYLGLATSLAVVAGMILLYLGVV
jgi:serine/threonine protein kinase